MKERPILFSAPMVRAILEGRKTQTRRIIKPQPEFIGNSTAWRWDGKKGSFRGAMGTHIEEMNISSYSPYGLPGDRLWVRETFMFSHHDFREKTDHFLYRATSPGGDTDAYEPPRWTPSIHMPRCASRIDLLVKNVRVERLQDISVEDAEAEGIKNGELFYFKELWESINGTESWLKNPWVWVVEFERIKP